MTNTTHITQRLTFENARDSRTLMYVIHQMCFLVQKHLEQALSRKKTISFSQFMILVGFKCSEGGRASQSEIAERLSFTEATVSRHITTLVGLGVLARTEDKENRRKHVITITQKGEKAFNAAAQMVEKELDALFTLIKEKDRTVMRKNFSTIVHNLLGKNC